MKKSSFSNSFGVSVLRLVAKALNALRLRSVPAGAGVLRFALALILLIGEMPAAAAGPRTPALSHGEVQLAAPVQTTLNRKKLYTKSGHQLEAVASFKIEARVLSAAKYRQGREALVSQVDLALGWGKMATDQVLSKIDVSQSGRFASMRYNPASGIEVSDIVLNSSNMHMIPSSNAVNKALRKVRKGQVVEIEGYLVNIRHEDGWRWLTSTSRTDQGNGACEIILVTSIRVVG